jgi:acetyl esterase/lipase
MALAMGNSHTAKLRWLLCAVLCLTTLAACDLPGFGGQGAQPTPTTGPTDLFSPKYSVSVRENVAYGASPAQTLDLCRPDGLSPPRPGVMLIHGGAWVSGSKRYQFDDFHTLRDLCRGLAAQGFLVASIDYRLLNLSGPLGAHSDPWPAQLEDAQLAVRWLRAHASELALDKARLCAAGLSVGAMLAVFLGALRTIDPGDQARRYPAESPQASCVADFYGPVDIVALLKAAPDANQDVFQALLGYTTPDENPEGYRAASPLFRVSSQTAPTLIVHGVHDQVVPIEQSLALFQALREHEVPAQFITYNGRHSFGSVNLQESRAIWSQVLAYLVAQERP